MFSIRLASLAVAVTAVMGAVGGAPAVAASHSSTEAAPAGPSDMMSGGMMGPGLMMPAMDPANGRKLFASKGCVVCHSVNGVGGGDAPPLDASTMPSPMNPFEFAARMWRGAEAMIYLQREEIGEQIEFTGKDLEDIIAFVHHPDEQHKFSDADIPPNVKALMHHMDEEEGDEHHEQEEGHQDE